MYIHNIHTYIYAYTYIYIDFQVNKADTSERGQEPKMHDQTKYEPGYSYYYFSNIVMDCLTVIFVQHKNIITKKKRDC